MGANTGSSLTISGVIDSGGNPYGLDIRTGGTGPDGTVVLSGANTYLGDTNIFIGRLRVDGGDDRLPAATRVVMGAGTNSTEFDLNGQSQEISGLSVASGATAANNRVTNASGTPSTLTVNTPTATPSTFDGVIEGNLTLTKTGEDTLTLNGSNSYSGNTLVNEGRLHINGTHVGGGLITVNPDGALGGTGSVGGVFVDNGGTLAPGESAGTLSVDSLTLSSTSRLEFELGAPNAGTFPSDSDFVFVQNDLLLAGQLHLTALPSFTSPNPGDSWVLFQYNGSLNNAGLSIATPTPGGPYLIDTTSVAGQVLLVAVPEPSSFLLLLLGATLVLRARNRAHR
jgi:autotransporter-associated beta strand protein